VFERKGKYVSSQRRITELLGHFMKLVYLSAILSFLFSSSVIGEEIELAKCIEKEAFKISGLSLGLKDTDIKNIFGDPSSVSYDQDVETSGQYSGFWLGYDGLEIFVADIGGINYIETTKSKHKSIFGLDVGMNKKEVSARLGLPLKNTKDIAKIRACEGDYDVTLTFMQLNFSDSDILIKITIDEYGL